MNMLLTFFGIVLTTIFIINIHNLHKLNHLKKQLINKQKNVTYVTNEMMNLDALNQSFHKQRDT